MDIATLSVEGHNAFLQGDYRKAESLLLKAYELIGTAHEKAHESSYVGIQEWGPVFHEHLTLSSLIHLYFKMRDTWAGAYEKCLRYCHEDLAIIFSDRFLNCGAPIPRCVSITRLLIDYEKKGQYQEAIDLCEKAMSFGFRDDTKGGFEGRLIKLKKKLAEKVD